MNDNSESAIRALVQICPPLNKPMPLLGDLFAVMPTRPAQAVESPVLIVAPPTVR